MGNLNFRNAPTAYLKANNALNKQPIYYCVFGLVTGPYGTNSQVLPNQYSTGPILNATRGRLAIMSAPTSFNAQINPVTYQYTLSQIQFNLQNRNGEATRICTNYTMKNRNVTIYRGFAGISEADYTAVYSGQINNAEKSQDGTYWTITVVDPLKQLTETILPGSTTLIAGYTPTPQLIKDGTVEWVWVSPGSNYPQWSASTFYASGAYVSNNGQNYQCEVTGTSSVIDTNFYGPTGVTPITGNSTNNTLNTIPDGSCLWTATSLSAVNETVTSIHPWEPGTVYGKGQFVFICDNSNGQLFQCIQNGTSANNFGPTYTGTSTVSDGSVTWQYAGTYAKSYPKWQPGTAYAKGDNVELNGVIYNAFQAGTSASPIGPSGVSSSITDGTCTWEYIGLSAGTQWQPSTEYQAGNVVLNYNGAYQAIQAGAGISQNFPALLNGPNSNGYTGTMSVSTVGYFATASDLYDGKGPRNFLRVNNNLYSYKGISSGFISDGSVVWTYLGEGLSTPWKPNTAYSVGQNVSNLDMLFVCVTAGVSAFSGGPTGTGDPTGTTENITGITGNAFTGVAPVTLDNNGGNYDTPQQAGSTVQNYVLFEGNPVDLMLQIILSTGNGSNWSGTGTNYDVLPSCQGIGVPWQQVDITGFETQRNQYLSWMTFSGYFSAQVMAISFIQKNILPVCHGYLYVNKAGQITFTATYAPIGTVDAITLDQTNIVGIPKFNAYLQTGGYFYNDITVSWDYQPISDYYLSQREVVDGTSISNYREDSSLPVTAQFVKSNFAGYNIANRAINIYLKRFSNPPPVITLQTFDSVNLLTPGALVYINHPNIPNYLTGKDGGNIPILCECINASPNFSDGSMSVMLLGIGFYQFKKYGRISPPSILNPNPNGGTFPTYLNANPAQKRYCFIGEKVGNSCQQSNGDAGYFIGP